ncbi:MAG TPA: sigma 54-interacting transcriptional regulator [Pyrinomonadaceae bacterium]|jgi:Nif-specific regulatory protein
MNPRLIIIAGPLQGQIFELTEEEVSIGRDAKNHVLLLDPSVSRRHSLIKREGEQFKILDLDSFNGTFVNGIPVSEHLLEQADHIAIGDVLLLFLKSEEQDSAETLPVRFDEGDLRAQTTMQLRRQDAFYLQQEKVLAVLPPTARVARGLNTLLKISTVINSIHGLEKLQGRLLELIMEVLPAERGVILLCQNDAEQLVPTVSLNKLSGKDEIIRVSLTIALQALREGVAIMSNNVSGNSSLTPSESLIASKVNALMCVPILLLDKQLGIIYLDTRDKTVAFDEHHLQLLTAIASMAAVAIESMQHIEQLENENHRITQEINIKHQMIGEGKRMRELYQLIAKVAPTDSTVLIRGESGTGKELVARAIHSNSLRAHKPFIAINCATLTESLLESELFGHEKGAFTGAVKQKLGKLEVADGGTVFLDEVGELAPNIQAKLLRVLQEREFERIGGTRPIKVDIRIIAATNKDMEEAVRQGNFRQDLYYRLNIIAFVIPPLRERREDIPLLASFFASECSKRVKRKPVRVSAEARTYLMNYDWPGNVRELENAIERAVVLGSTDLIMPEDLPEAILETVTAQGAPIAKFYDVLRETKKQLIINAIQQANGNYAEAARLLGVHPNNLHRLIRNMNLKSGVTK